MMENSPFYDLFRNMWVLGSVTKDQLKLRVPVYISLREYNEIVALPQDGVIPLRVLTED